MRNPFTNLLRKKKRRSITRKRRSNFATTPLERLSSKHLFEEILLFAGASNFLSHFAFRSHLLNNPVTTHNALVRSRLAAFIADVLIRLESLIGDVRVDPKTYRVLQMPMASLCMSHFQNDEHCENLTRFMKSELFD